MRLGLLAPAFVGMLGVAGCATSPIPTAPVAAAVAPAAGEAPAGMQYLYGSGEAAAASRQAWNALVAYAGERVRQRPRDGVVLAKGATLAAPAFEPCGAKPYAAVFDVDETVLLNRGFEYDAATGQPYSDARWQAYEVTGVTTTVATPGAKEGLDALRRLGVTVVFNTNRAADHLDATVAALTRAGLGPAVHGETLFLKGDDATGSRKDARRERIADRYCVIAMGGDQLGDFTDLFNGSGAVALRRDATGTAALARLWGRGWFVLPNPVYGTALKGTLDEIFPADARWAPEP